MSSLIRAMRSTAAVALLLTIAGCASVQSRADRSGPAAERPSERERVAHVLSRLTFGPRSGDAERVAAMGVDRWIEQQLRPEMIPDSAVVVALAPIRPWSDPVATLAKLPDRPRFVQAAVPVPATATA